ncbi:hypothetical protein JB92DRAFT_2837212 [Gautieria morchelliformis]|nr:hypothetical protein JB92DRAFT_2837212 [Gautieria morchelliformis]
MLAHKLAEATLKTVKIKNTVISLVWLKIVGMVFTLILCDCSKGVHAAAWLQSFFSLILTTLMWIIVISCCMGVCILLTLMDCQNFYYLAGPRVFRSSRNSGQHSAFCVGEIAVAVPTQRARCPSGYYCRRRRASRWLTLSYSSGPVEFDGKYFSQH